MTAAGDLTLPGGGALTTFVCAAYDYDLELGPTLAGLLPEVVHVPADPVHGRDVAALVELLAAELGGRRAGHRAATARLLDLLLVAAMRRAAPEAQPSWLNALRDPVVGRVLALLHERPAERWTLAALAREAHVSRATLARRFALQVGEPPLAYLARWRMQLAARRLKDSGESVEEIARRVGYGSEFAFNRAFARHRGVPPGRYRRLARSADQHRGDEAVELVGAGRAAE
jgi:AraC-like DNA-binding protein